nr:hypothetical protein Iba_chr05cCG11150 [Ipomoea batatas]
MATSASRHTKGVATSLDLSYGGLRHGGLAATIDIGHIGVAEHDSIKGRGSSDAATSHGHPGMAKYEPLALSSLQQRPMMARGSTVRRRELIFHGPQTPKKKVRIGLVQWQFEAKKGGKEMARDMNLGSCGCPDTRRNLFPELTGERRVESLQPNYAEQSRCWDLSGGSATRITMGLSRAPLHTGSPKRASRIECGADTGSILSEKPIPHGERYVRRCKEGVKPWLRNPGGGCICDVHMDCSQLYMARNSRSRTFGYSYACSVFGCLLGRCSTPFILSFTLDLLVIVKIVVAQILWLLQPGSQAKASTGLCPSQTSIIPL